MKKFIALLLALLMVFSLVACGEEPAGPAEEGGAEGSLTLFDKKNVQEDEILIAFIPMSTGGAVNSINQIACDDIMATYPNVKINFLDAGFDATTQITLINECITQGYSAIIMECVDSTAVGPTIQEAEEAGVAIITSNLDSDVPHTLFLKQDSYSAGVVTANAMAEMLGNEGKILLLDVPAAQAVSTTFCKGFEDTVADIAGIEILEYINLAGNAQEDAYNTMRDMLTKYPEIDGVYGPDDSYALGIKQAIKEAGREDEGILVFGADIQPVGIDAIRSGEIAGSSWSSRYNAMYTACSMALYYAQAGINGYALGYTETPALYFNFTAVTADNVDEIAPLTRWPGY